MQTNAAENNAVNMSSQTLQAYQRKYCFLWTDAGAMPGNFSTAVHLVMNDVNEI